MRRALGATVEARSRARCWSRARCSGSAARRPASSWRSCSSTFCCRSTCRCPMACGSTFTLASSWRALLDWRVLAFTAGAGVLAGGLLGLVPAVHGTRADLGSALKTGSRGSDAPGPLRWRNVMVVAQIAMSLVLLVGAGLFLRSWQQMLAVDPGFGRAPTSILSVMMPVTRSAPDDAVQRTRRLLERFRTLPGVEAVGLVWPLPLELSSSDTDFTIDGRVPPAGREAFRADAGDCGRRILRRRRHDDRGWPHLQRWRPARQSARGHHQPGDGPPLLARRRRAGPHPPPARSGRGRPDGRGRGERHQRALARGSASRRRLPELYAGPAAAGGQLRRPRGRRSGADGAGARRRRPAGRSGLAGHAVDDDGAASGDVETAVADRRRSCSRRLR